MKRHRIKLIALAAICSCLTVFAAAAATITTKSYKVTLIENCDEDVACQDVSFTAERLYNGRRIQLKGRAVTSICNDGITPCHHLGYKFIDNGATYFISDDGWFEISGGSKIILHEEITYWDRD